MLGLWKHCGCVEGLKVWLELWAVTVRGSTCSGLAGSLMTVIAVESVLVLRTAQILSVVLVAIWTNPLELAPATGLL